MDMKKIIIALMCLTFNSLFSQDTFSIVAVDSVTGEVGSAGASCVDLFQTTLSSDDFLGQLVPGVGAINTQAYYLPANQTNARNQMNSGKTPIEIIDWLVANDVEGTPQKRQYGIVAMINGSPQAAGHTGTATDDYKNHIVGPNYAIQGNILLGQQVLDSMEARFLKEEGDLACKLMAALQGAKMVGADARCASNGSSSLFSFVKVSLPTDPYGSPSFLTSVRTHTGAGIEPIDSLQTKFDLIHSCSAAGMDENDLFDQYFRLYPNSTSEVLNIEFAEGHETMCHYEIIQVDGSVALKGEFMKSITINISSLKSGSYIVKLSHLNAIYSKKIIIQ